MRLQSYLVRFHRHAQRPTSASASLASNWMLPFAPPAPVAGSNDMESMRAARTRSDASVGHSVTMFCAASRTARAARRRARDIRLGSHVAPQNAVWVSSFLSFYLLKLDYLPTP